MPTEQVLNVTGETKERAESYRRKLEAAIDEDLTQNELVEFLLDHAPAPDRSTEGPGPWGEADAEMDTATYSGDVDSFTVSNPGEETDE